MSKYTIRKLTPEECMILQGMRKSDVDKCKSIGTSDSQIYKQAGNGLGTPCIKFIMQHLYKMNNPSYVTTDELMAQKYM